MASKFSKVLKLKAATTWFKVGGAVTPRLAARLAYVTFFIHPFRHKPLPSDVAMLSQANVLDINFENRNIRGYSWGDGDKAVLLVHGWSSHALTMSKFIQPLLDCGFKVIAFDAPAHGNSEGKRTGGQKYRRFIRVLLDEYEPYAIIAHSLGAICTLCELAEPHVKVKKVVVLATPVTSTMMVHQFLEKARLHSSAHKHFDNFIQHKLGIEHHQFDLSLIYPDGIPYAGMIVHDANDMLIPFTESVKLAQIWPQAKILTTHGLDHSGILSDTGVVDSVISFITE